MPLQATSGAASYDAFGGGVPVEPNYIESVFSTFLYTGNGSTQTINNGIDLAGEGGLVWTKARSAANRHALVDTVRGGSWELASNLTDGQNAISPATTFGATGYTMNDSATSFNLNGVTYASWTFRKQPKFFDVVTYTGNGATSRTISHNLGSAPGVLILKATGASSSWSVFHRSLGVSQTLLLNDTTGAFGASGRFGSSAPTATTFDINDIYNTNGVTYIAYVFAHNAGGFGLTGTDNVISCGSFTGSNNLQVTLGWEPQFIIAKRTDSSSNGDWFITDNMRSWNVGDTPRERFLLANSSVPESLDSGGTNPYGNCDSWQPNATGFQITGFPLNEGNFIYIAIRRGPMKTPTSGTSVFDPELTAAATGTTVTTNFPIDLQLYRATGVLDNTYVVDRLRGVNTTAVNTSTPRLFTSTTGAESTDAVTRAWDNTGFQTPLSNGGVSSIYWNFRRAPGFFDEVCYTGTGTTLTLNHNLGVKPELIILKVRSTTQNWPVYHNMTATTLMRQLLNSGTGDPNARLYSDGYGLSAEPTSTTISITPTNTTLFNGTGATYVAYLFASCPGVSKVFSYTGNGTSQTINCGFTGGARFVMIKRTDSTGNWMVADTARGLVAAGDPTLYLNSTAAEVTGVDWIDPDSSGFIVNQEGTMNANVNGGTYVGIAVA